MFYNHINFSANSDTDGDLLTPRQEFLARTDPIVPASTPITSATARTTQVLVPTNLQISMRPSGNIMVSWEGSSGADYTVDRSIAGSAWNPSMLVPNEPFPGSFETIDPATADQEYVYYRIRWQAP